MEALIALITVVGMLTIALLERLFENKRFDKRLRREHEIEERERLQKVRDEPLLKLRVELARMASRYDRLIELTKLTNTSISIIPKEEHEKWIEKAQDDFNSYMENGEFGQALFTIDDKELMEKVNKLQLNYHVAFLQNVFFDAMPPDIKLQTITQGDELAEQVREIQDLINQRLEEI